MPIIIYPTQDNVYMELSHTSKIRPLSTVIAQSYERHFANFG